jgi:hypothetical protein
MGSLGVNRKIRFHLLILFWAHVLISTNNKAFAVVRQDEFSCTRPNPTWSIDEVADWAESMDLIGERATRPVGQRDHVTAFDSPIDRNCSNGQTDAQWSARQRKIDAALARALSGSQRCEATLGLHMRPVLLILRRARLRCFTEAAGPDGMMTLASAEQGGGTSPTVNHRYDLNLNTNYLDSSSVEELAATLVHEALHWTRHNNTEWHNHNAHKSRTTCSNSIFEDRVYMMGAACFPESRIGKNFYGASGAASCPNICQTALTSSDSAAVHWSQRFFQHGSEGLYGGRLGAGDARSVCQRISQVSANYKRAQDEKGLISTRARMINRYVAKHSIFNLSPEGQTARDEIQDFYALAKEIYNPSADRALNYQLMRQKAQSALEYLSEKCQAPVSNDWYGFCGQWAAGDDPVSRDVAAIIRRVERSRLDDINLYTR